VGPHPLPVPGERLVLALRHRARGREAGAEGTENPGGSEGVGCRSAPHRVAVYAMTGSPRVDVTGNTSRSAPRWAALYRTMMQSSLPDSAIAAASGRWWVVTPSRRTTPSDFAARRYSTTPPGAQSASHSSPRST
jgi:hypothetical protein